MTRPSFSLGPHVAPVALTAFVVSVFLGILLSRSAVPPGADPGHMLALSYAFDGDASERLLVYPPGLPFLMFVLRHLAGDHVDSLLAFVKILGIGLLLFQATGLALLAGAIGGRTAAAWTFVLAALAPAAWNQLAWGGYAQFLGVGLGSAGLGWVVRTTLGGKRALLAGGFLGCAALVHHYSAFFFMISAIVLVFRAYRQGQGKQVWAIGPSAVLTAALSIPTYHQMWLGLNEGSQNLGQRVEGYAIAMVTTIQNVTFHPITNGILIAVLLLTLAAGRRSGPEMFRSLAPLGWGCLALLAVTPPLQLARAGVFIGHALVVFMGITLAGTPATHLKKLVAACLAILPVVTLFDLSRLVPHYAPIGKDDVNAMLDLGRTAPGRTLIVSPNPNIDGWWFEGLSGRSALVGDHLKWYVFETQRRTSVDAQLLAHAPRILDGDSLKVLDMTSSTSSSYMLWALDEVEFYPLLRFSSSDEVEIEGSPAGFQLTSNAGLDIEPSPGVRVREISRNDATLIFKCEYLYEPFRWKGLSRTVKVDLLSDPPDLFIDGQNARIDPLDGASVRIEVEEFRPSHWQPVVQKELLDRWNVTHALVRGPGVERFRRDPRFELLWQRGQMTAFRVSGS